MIVERIVVVVGMTVIMVMPVILYGGLAVLMVGGPRRMVVIVSMVVTMVMPLIMVAMLMGVISDVRMRMVVCRFAQLCSSCPVGVPPG